MSDKIGSVLIDLRYTMKKNLARLALAWLILAAVMFTACTTPFVELPAESCTESAAPTDEESEAPVEIESETEFATEPEDESETESATEASTDPESESESEQPTLQVPDITGIEFISSTTGAPYEDISFELDGDTIKFGYPLIVPDSDVHAATLRFITDGVIEDRTYDLKETHEITLTLDDGTSKTYTLEPYRLSYSLPVMQIYTDDGAAITSKTEYVHGTLYIDGEAYEMKIRGRGNASWSQFPKKSYRIKLDSGSSLFGLPKNRDWVLTSNYADKTLIRNQVAHRIAASLDGLEFTSTHISVNLYLNGEYLGVYTFADKIEEGAGRLDFSPKDGDIPSGYGSMDIGFICEVGWDYDSENIYNKDYFDAEEVIRIYVKEPKIEYANSPEFNYVKGYLLAMEDAILNGGNWQDYIDIDSWVDWFIVTELTFNTESVFYRSCYFWKREGGKLMLGPVWDFDMAFGNHQIDIKNYDGFCTTETEYEYISENWLKFLFEYEEFREAVKTRWNEVKDSLLVVALTSVDECSAALSGSVEQNFKRWNIMSSQIGMGAVSPYVYNTYEKQVEYLRDFISQRWTYMDERINREF